MELHRPPSRSQGGADASGKKYFRKPFKKPISSETSPTTTSTNRTTIQEKMAARKGLNGGGLHQQSQGYISIPKWKSKRSFPFLTPTQALRTKLGIQEDPVTPIAEDTLRIIPFGGVEQVGLNCIGFEYGNELLIVDMGLQFPDQYQYGINSSIPDLRYALTKKIVGVCITHGHIDHIGGVPMLMKQIGKTLPIYATSMAHELIAMKQQEVGMPLVNLREYKRYTPVVLSENFTVTPFTVDHSIPDSVGLLIETPVGRFVHTGDWKFDKNPLPNRPSTDYKFLESIGNRGVRALLSDSTNAHLLGSSISESEVVGSIEEIIAVSTGRVITATFSSIIDRVMIIIAAAEKYNRKVVLLGRSMNNYMEIAFKLGYSRPKPGTMISMEDADKLPDNEVVICCTGAQGERYAALMRISTGESKDTILKPQDTVIFSSSVIPGNERNVQLLYDLIYEQGPRVYHYKESEIHAGGHARADDTKKMISLIRPEIYMPIYGFPHMLYGNARNAREMGYSDDKIILSKNGQVIEFTKDSFRITSMFVPHALVTIDGYTVGMTKETELHERYQLSSQGIFMISIAKKPGKFLYEMETIGMPSMDEFPAIKKKIEATLDELLKTSLSKFPTADHFKKFVTKKLSDILFDELGKEPLVNVLVH